MLNQKKKKVVGTYLMTVPMWGMNMANSMHTNMTKQLSAITCNTLGYIDSSRAANTCTRNMYDING